MKNFSDQYLDKEMVLGIRPGAISVKGDLDYQEQGFLAHINLFEQLGEETLLYVTFPGKKEDLIISTTGLGRFHKEMDVGISFNLEHVCLFSKETGESLLKR